MVVTAAATERSRARAATTDRFTVITLSLAAVLVLVALLAWQMRSTAPGRARPVVVLRRVYVTHVIETVPGGARGAGSVTQSVSSSATGTSLASGPTTSSSH